MIQNNPHDDHPHTATLTGIEAEYEQLCRKMRPDYARFRKEQPEFLGGYGVYLEAMQIVQDEIRGRAELARLDQEQREIRDYFLHPPICLMPERDRQELLRLFADDADQDKPNQDKADDPVSEFIHDDDYRYCRVPGLPPFEFSKQQGLAVKKIHEAMGKGKLGLTAEEIFHQIGSYDTDYRLRRLFRGKAMAAIDTGFLKELRTGFWTLDIMAGKRP